MIQALYELRSRPPVIVAKHSGTEVVAALQFIAVAAFVQFG